MPMLSDTLMSNNNTEGMTHLEARAPQTPPNSEVTQPSVYSTFMRCPLPPIWVANPDSVRQFYVSGRVPQFRIYAPSVVKQ